MLLVLVRAYGLFWRADEVDWTPGRGARGAFRLLGRLGAYLPGLELADFRQQRGIYILYGNLGPHYVGLTRKQGLGKRLKDHLSDEHGGLWDRFSWFGFREVLKGRDKHGLQRLRALAEVGFGRPDEIIGDVEALLIKAMALRNRRRMNFCSAQGWEQVKLDEVETFISRIA